MAERPKYRPLWGLAASLIVMVLAGSAQAATIYCPQDGTPTNGRCDGTPNADTIFGTSGPNKIYGNGGSDVISGRQGDDFLYGGAGNDWLAGGTGSDLLSGYTGADTLIGDDDTVKDLLHCGDGPADQGYFGPFDFHAGGCEWRF